ncbi:CAIB/BAIF family protein [Orrella dioscoreae]|uniref:CAIB/BAIF family protein n=2 Tax=Orrella dioscoreae TaxID=1851544 RepID=A0A1C3K6Y3_9BURK|nr:CAIB/BAIF family protein [Orrella dioscoreae]SOE46143.1 CAIB/BAIF family protein [Orrella dioscoreae]
MGKTALPTRLLPRVAAGRMASNGCFWNKRQSVLKDEMAMAALDTLETLWRLAGLPAEGLAPVQLPGRDPVFPSSFPVGLAAQVTTAAAALAACELAHLRGTPRQQVTVQARQAAIECTGWFLLDGKEPEYWDPITGLYETADGHVRIHANFAHHRDGALRLLGLDVAHASRDTVQQALRGWRAIDFETAAAARGLVVTALRSFAQWDGSPQGRAVAAQPVMTFTRLDDAPPLALPALDAAARPLSGVRVLDLTRILAGPMGGRALASHGADVMLVNSPTLPNIGAIVDTSRGKRSALVDLDTAAGRDALWSLVDGAHVFSQGYRPGSLAAKGFSPRALAARRPGLVMVSLSAYGTKGPWAGRRGFDSLLQTAMGFNHAEGEAAGDGKPRAMPMQILDQATGFLMAFGAAAALWRQQSEGGSWLVEVSLAQTAQWLRGLGRVDDGLACPRPDVNACLQDYPCGYGALRALPPAAELARTPAGYVRASVPPGTDAPSW